MLFSRQNDMPTKSDQSYFEAYINLWKDNDVHLPKDISILPCHKEKLKRIIIDQMRGRPDDLRHFLVLIYERLSLFQKLSATDRKALSSAYIYVGSLAAKSGVFGESEKAKLGMMLYADEACRHLMNRVVLEDQNLQENLVRGGHLSEAERQLDLQCLADLANAKNAELGLQMTMTAADFSAQKMVEGARHAHS